MKIRPTRIARSVGTKASVATAMAIAVAPTAATASLASADVSHGPTASVSNGALVINGTERDDNVQIGLTADPGFLFVDLGDGTTPQSFDRSTFDVITVRLHAGDDVFAVSTRGGAFNDDQLVVDGGPGDDHITGGAGSDLLVGGAGDDSILGGDGNDVIVGGAGHDVVDGQRGADDESLGGGDDVAVWLPGEGSDVIDGGDDADTLVFVGANGNEKDAVFADASHAVLTRDVGTIRMDTVGVERLSLSTLGGVDAVAVGDLTGTDLRNVDIDLAKAAGGGDTLTDSVSVAGSDRADAIDVTGNAGATTVAGLDAQTRITGSDASDLLHINAGDGNDTATVDAAAHALMNITVDLGAGQL